MRYSLSARVLQVMALLQRRIIPTVIAVVLLSSAEQSYAIVDATFQRTDRAVESGAQQEVKPISNQAFKPLSTPTKKNNQNLLKRPTALPIPDDGWNHYSYSECCRVIIGKSYASDVNFMEDVDAVTESADFVINRYAAMGFYPPRGSEDYYLDIYIGNKKAYRFNGAGNPVKVTLGAGYAGYATDYQSEDSDKSVENVAFLVIGDNHTLPGGLMELTLAHEIFHAVQFSYKAVDDYVDDDLWVLEAMATAMEEIIYPEIDDYIHFVNDFYRNHEYSLSHWNGSHEYGASIFILYLVQRYQIDIVKDILLNIEQKNGWKQVIESALSGHGENFNEMYKGFVTALYQPQDYFSDGAEFRVDYLRSRNATVEDEIHLSKEYAIYTLKAGEPLQINGTLLNTGKIEQVEQAAGGEQCAVSQKVGDAIPILCAEDDQITLFTTGSVSETITPEPSSQVQLQGGWNLVAVDRSLMRSKLKPDVAGKMVALRNLTGVSPLAGERGDILSTLVNDKSDSYGEMVAGYIESGADESLQFRQRTESDISSISWHTMPAGWLLVPYLGTQAGTVLEIVDQIEQYSGYQVNRVLLYKNGQWTLFNPLYGVGAAQMVSSGEAVWVNIYE